MKILLATFHDRLPAQALRDRLEHAGIPAKVGNDTFIQRYIFFVKPAATFQVWVNPDDFDQACEKLTEWDKNENILKEAVRCLDCRSPRIEYPQYTRKFFAPLVVEWLISLGGAEKDYYCTDCHYTWPRVQKPEPELDVLGFPKRTPKHSSKPH